MKAPEQRQPRVNPWLVAPRVVLPTSMISLERFSGGEIELPPAGTSTPGR